MRVWFSGPRLFGGAIRPGVSFGAEDFTARSGIRFGRPNPGAPGAVQTITGDDFVYVIAGTHGLVKIGISSDPIRRLSSLQTASPHPLTLAFTVPTYGNAYVIEQEAHRVLGAHRSSGEWFAVSQEMAIAAIYAAADRTGCRIAGLNDRAPLMPDKSPWPLISWPRSSIGQIFLVVLLLWGFGSILRGLGY